MTREYVNEYLELFESLLRAMRNGDSFHEEEVSERARNLKVSIDEYLTMRDHVRDILAQEEGYTREV